MKHLRKFNTVADLNAAIANSTIGMIGLAYNNGTPVMKKKDAPSGPDYSEPFYINVRGAVTLAATSGLQMSTDKTNWTDTTATTLSSGKTYIRVASDQSEPLYPSWTEDENSDYDIGGNINSLVKVNFENDGNSYPYVSMFAGKQHLKSASNLILPATELTESCYQGIFSNCTSLIAAPELPATTLAFGCYAGLFENCTSLTTAPELPATTLVIGCYEGMFYGCTSLTTAPELPATTLANACYASMFYGCTSLNYIKCLATDISADGCLQYWVNGVSSTGTFVKNPSMPGWSTGESGIPSGWTVEDATE